jgi:hypothetical protein
VKRCRSQGLSTQPSARAKALAALAPQLDGAVKTSALREALLPTYGSLGPLPQVKLVFQFSIGLSPKAANQIVMIGRPGHA